MDEIDEIKDDRYNFFITDREIWQYKLNPYEFTTYSCLLSFANHKTGETFTGITTLVEYTQMSKPKLLECIKSLESKKLISVKRGNGEYLTSPAGEKTFKRASNIYTIQPIEKQEKITKGSKQDLLGSKQDLLGVVNDVYKGSKPHLQGVVSHVDNNKNILTRDINKNILTRQDNNNLETTLFNNSLGNKEYIKQVYDLWQETENEICPFPVFIQKDYKNAIQYLKGIHSNDILQAIKNYTQVRKNPNTFDGWRNQTKFENWTRRHLLDFSNPNFNITKYFDNSKAPNITHQEQKPQRIIYCKECNNPVTNRIDFICAHCNRRLTDEEIDGIHGVATND